tara:strand:- start:554 stop:850 length:297 start_codon:yes stop_codon:yes gene_type:complete
MSELKLPSYSIPIIAAVISGAVVWGSTQANLAFAQDERSRIMEIAQETAKKAQANTQGVAINSTKLEVIVQSLQEQKDIQNKTNEQIAQLVQALLSRQ